MRWFVVGGLLAVAACSSSPAQPPQASGDSNIYAADYVGPDRCGECHEDNHASWQVSLHATMNQRADAPGAMWGDASLAYAGGTATLAGQVMSTVSPAGVERRYRITRTIGTRYLQEYVGVQDGGPDVEIRLPFGAWKRAGGLLPRTYFDSWYPPEYTADGALAHDPYAPDVEPWATRCAWCHNTYAFEVRAVRAAEVGLGHGLEQFVALDVVRRAPASRKAIAEDNRLPVDELITVGISCESCHLGGRDHAEREAEISFTPRSADLRSSITGGRDNPVVVDAICAQCHSTPSPRWPNQAAVRNSTEALDLLAGACAPATASPGFAGTRSTASAVRRTIACTDCHDPHVAGPGPGAPDQPAHLDACAGCHPAQVTPAHSRHTGVSCLDCHMPRIVQGLSAIVRSHRISSPSDDAMLSLDTPNACNLCHLDRSLTWTLEALEAGWGRYARGDDPGGDAGDELGLRWLRAGGALGLTAAAAYARSPLGRAALPALLDGLDHPVAYDRMWRKFAVEDVLGRALTPAEYDPLAPPATRAAQLARLRAAL